MLFIRVAEHTEIIMIIQSFACSTDASWVLKWFFTKLELSLLAPVSINNNIYIILVCYEKFVTHYKGAIMNFNIRMAMRVWNKNKTFLDFKNIQSWSSAF